MDSSYAKPDDHTAKVACHTAEYVRREVAKVERLERRSGDGHRIKEGPKKDGNGRGNWGTYKDDPIA